MTKRESIIYNAQLIRDVTPLDCNVIITDRDAKILHFVPAMTFDANCVIGEFASGGLIVECLQSRQVVKGVIPGHVYGVPLKAIIHPIIEKDGTLAGVIGTSTSLKEQTTLQNAVQAIASTSQQMSATAEALAVDASRLSELLSEMKMKSEAVNTEIAKTNDILRFVSDIAANSNLLGLNAAIEAARAGEHGRGFIVVANEIRSMAENSRKSVERIKQILKSVQVGTVDVVKAIDETSQLGEHQEGATQQISASMQCLAASAGEIRKISEII